MPLLVRMIETSQSRSSLLRRAFSFYATLTRPAAGGGSGFSLHEAEALLAALTQLVDEGTRSLVAQQPQGALPVLDA